MLVVVLAGPVRWMGERMVVVVLVFLVHLVAAVLCDVAGTTEEPVLGEPLRRERLVRSVARGLHRLARRFSVLDRVVVGADEVTAGHTKRHTHRLDRDVGDSFNPAMDRFA